MPLPRGGPVTSTTTPAQGEDVYKRDNIDFKVNYQPSTRLSLFGATATRRRTSSIRPRWARRAATRWPAVSSGTAPGRHARRRRRRHLHLRARRSCSTSTSATRTRSWAPRMSTSTRNFGLDVLHIPGTNGPDRLQGGIPSFQITGWANLGNPNTGNPFQFDDKQYVAAVNLQWLKGAHALRFGFDYQNQQLNHFQPQGGTFQTRARHVPVQRQHDAPAERAGAGGRALQQLGGLPARAAERRRQGRPAPQSRTRSACRRTRSTRRISGRLSRDLTLNLGLRWEYLPVADARRRPGRVALRSGRRQRLHRRRRRRAARHRAPARAGPVPAARSASPIARRQDRAPRRLRAQPRTPKPFIDFRNAFPINFAWSHPAVTFNGVTNAFMPVTTLRLGLDTARFGAAPDLGQGVLRLPVGRGHHDLPEGAGARGTSSPGT